MDNYKKEERRGGFRPGAERPRKDGLPIANKQNESFFLKCCKTLYINCYI